MNDTFDRLSEVFRTVFEDDDRVITRETSAANVPYWDSLMHVSLIVSVEREFGIRFLSSEVTDLKNLGELCDLVERKLKA